MKSIAHAWVGLMALERLKAKGSKKGFISTNCKKFYLGGKFHTHYNKQAELLTKFFDRHKDAFVQGAWFPDNVISDNLTGGHTYKLSRGGPGAAAVANRTPDHLSSASLVKRFSSASIRVRKCSCPGRSSPAGTRISGLITTRARLPGRGMANRSQLRARHGRSKPNPSRTRGI